MNELTHLLYDPYVLNWISPKRHSTDIIIKNDTESIYTTDWRAFYSTAINGFSAYLETSEEKGLDSFLNIMKRLFIRNRIYYQESPVSKYTQIHEQIANIIKDLECSDTYTADTLIIYMNLPQGSNVGIYQLGMFLRNLKKEYKHFKRFITTSSEATTEGRIIVTLGMKIKR